jgi:hypothetical protein
MLGSGRIPPAARRTGRRGAARGMVDDEVHRLLLRIVRAEERVDLALASCALPLVGTCLGRGAVSALLVMAGNPF